MRLLVLTHRLPYAPNRGDRIRAYHLLKALAREHEVHLISLVHDDEEQAKVASLDLGICSAQGARVSKVRGLLAAARVLPSSVPLTHALLDSPQLRPLVATCERSVRPEAVLAYCTGIAHVAFEPPLDRLPFILDMVDVDSEKWAALGATTRAPKGWIYRREARVLRAFERRAAARALVTTVVSEREQEVATHALGGTSSAVVSPNGIDLTSFAPTAPPVDSETVVFCGVFNYAPNEQAAVWLATEVWPLVRQHRPGAQLQLVGMHPTRAVQALASPASIVVTGAVPDVRPYLWSAAASAAPLQVARGVQNKVLEALAAGLPCVVTPAVHDGLPTSVQPATRVATSPRQFAGALLELLALTPAARRSEAATADLASLDWQTQLEPLLSRLRTAHQMSQRSHLR